MRCPFCAYSDTRVVDSRQTGEGSMIRRRRECTECGRRFTTYEKVDEPPLVVVKKDKSREVFDRNKVLHGILKACHKRPVSANAIEDAVDSIEKELRNSMELEVLSEQVGELVMAKLKSLDGVAYIRFASVYKEFGDVKKFAEEVKNLLEIKEGL